MRRIIAPAVIGLCLALLFILPCEGLDRIAMAWVLEIQGSGHALDSGGALRTIRVGTPLYEGDRVKADRGSLVRVIFEEDGIATVSADQMMVISSRDRGTESTGSTMKRLYMLICEKIKGHAKAADEPTIAASRTASVGSLIVADPVFPRNSRLIEDMPKLLWSGEAGKKYRVVIYASDNGHGRGSELWRETIRGLTVQSQQKDIPLRPGSYYVWGAIPDGDHATVPRALAWFYVLDERDREKLNRDLQALESSLPPSDALMRSLMQAAFYENEELYHEARECYAKVLKMEGGTSYEPLYRNLLYKMGYPEAPPADPTVKEGGNS
jgi:hypothetical protein